ncbi:hypothetical protein LVY72_14750 [Arthrobacter sp. I2-34]|uniref:Uncharacterized protein n=1 Tax=Arthrobacter hankyongi TaxID=2904801 RepID=A0ABS9L912_9MICC|nr:hypothetical protein [Arthrobacter hankyongi]MCG2623155.1 hypothetical protein [Arthrobacter hankyongi]
MDVNELSARIQEQYRGELTAFRQELFGPEEILVVRGESVPEQRFASMGRVVSLEEPGVSLTLVGEVTDLGWTAEDPIVSGACVTVSIAGHDRGTDARASLPADETDAWLQAVIGAERVRHAYRAGSLSGADGRPGTVYYRLFLDTEGNPIPKPDSFEEPELRPMDEL